MAAETQVVKEEPVTTQAVNGGNDYDRSELPELLRIYYSRLFPYDKYFEWLQYGESILICLYSQLARALPCSQLRSLSLCSELGP